MHSNGIAQEQCTRSRADTDACKQATMHVILQAGVIGWRLAIDLVGSEHRFAGLVEFFDICCAFAEKDDGRDI